MVDLPDPLDPIMQLPVYQVPGVVDEHIDATWGQLP